MKLQSDIHSIQDDLGGLSDFLESLVAGGYDPFFLYPVLMAFGFSALAAPLGSIMVWKRLSFFGDTIAHSSCVRKILRLSFIFHTEKPKQNKPNSISIYVKLLQIIFRI